MPPARCWPRSAVAPLGPARTRCPPPRRRGADAGGGSDRWVGVGVWPRLPRGPSGPSLGDKRWEGAVWRPLPAGHCRCPGAWSGRSDVWAGL